MAIIAGFAKGRRLRMGTFLIVVIGLALWAGYTARNKNRSGLLWFLITCLTGGFGLAIILLIPRPTVIAPAPTLTLPNGYVMQQAAAPAPKGAISLLGLLATGGAIILVLALISHLASMIQ
jgi:hypothetical protein